MQGSHNVSYREQLVEAERMGQLEQGAVALFLVVLGCVAFPQRSDEMKHERIGVSEVRKSLTLHGTAQLW